MKKAKKERKRTPMPEDYNELICNIDKTLKTFNDLKSEVESNWYWWRLSIYAQRESITKACERAQKIWSDCKELATKRAGLIDLSIHQESFLLDSQSFTESACYSPIDEFAFYFATSKDGTEAECSKIARIADSAVNELWFSYSFFADGFEFSQYLDGFVGVRNAPCSNKPRIAYVPSLWFEFVYSMAVKINSMKSRCFEIPTVLDSPPAEHLWIEQDMRIIQNLPAPDFRQHPEVRLIEHDICEASILALEFLKTKVEERIQKPAETEQDDKKLQVEWIKVGEAASIAHVSPGTITRWADGDKVKDNGKKNRKRRIEKTSLLVYMQKRKEKERKKGCDEYSQQLDDIPEKH